MVSPSTCEFGKTLEAGEWSCIEPNPTQQPFADFRQIHPAGRRHTGAVSLAGVLYEVEAELVGAKVARRYDPLAPPGRPLQVWHEGRCIQLAKPVDLAANCWVKRHAPASAGLKLHQLGDGDEPEKR